MAALFQFVMRSGPNAGKIYPLEAADITIGRDAANGVAINDAEVSRKHAQLSLHGSSYVIQDLGSTNGTFVNGQRISTTQVLNPGDTVSFGENIVLQYEAAFDPNATVVGAKAPRTAVPAPKPAPAPAPAYVPPAAPAAAPAPMYSGQVPAGPAPVAAAPAAKKGSKAWIIIVIVIILVLCLCVGAPIIADALKMDCVVPFKWLFNLVGPMFGYGTCP
jgi:predicted component of type VI protein secretion system